ncbi:deleted in malignant brain tumors 1 protein [Biomphalaria pfeifferi]|uniref:Deleted in malignant brain tumors 1 protein n=1 Tax=Biomphalaria pfeifferi TaxID=112525 RepID=A0AAD8BJ03_BIOPF|nr:deleted in malignant brain tumors 1 protein [Biomphalaria pfeifferi]
MLWILLVASLLDPSNAECNQKYVVKTGQAIDVVSHSYPYNFTRNVHCFYDFITEFNSGNIIHVKVQEVNLSCEEQTTSLEVYDAFRTSPKLVGRICQSNPMIFVSPKERLYLVFKSSGAGGSGFKLRVEAVPEFTHCYKEKTKVVNAHQHSQVIVSPYYPVDVATSVNCKWLIKAPLGHTVILDILDAKMRGSHDCTSFGLYIYDGKTNYDDERIAKICDHVTTTSFTSSSVYMTVVFTSGPNVLHAGGGVKLAFRSSYVEDETEKDYSLLFILIGVLLGVASYTVLMVILRYVVVPARRKGLSRQCGHDRSASLTPLRSVSVTSSIIEPPPPYRATEDLHHNKRGIIGGISRQLRNLFRPARPSSHPDEGVVNSAFDYHAGEQYTSAAASPGFVVSSVGSNVALEHIKMNDLVTNDYRELPHIPRTPSANAGDSENLYDTLSSVSPYTDASNYAECYQPVEDCTGKGISETEFSNDSCNVHTDISNSALETAGYEIPNTFASPSGEYNTTDNDNSRLSPQTSVNEADGLDANSYHNKVQPGKSSVEQAMANDGYEVPTDQSDSIEGNENEPESTYQTICESAKGSDN